MKLTKSKIRRIENFIKKRLDYMNWIHTQAIRPIAKKLAKLEKANSVVVDVAVLFHDLGKPFVKNTKPHAPMSVKLAKQFLERNNFDKEFITQVLHCVSVHEYPWHDKSKLVDTKEAKVVFDADMIQQLSPFGLVKHFLKYSKDGFKKAVINSQKTLLKAHRLILTKNGKKMAKDRLKYTKDFFKELIINYNETNSHKSCQRSW